ncbi:hypothetical protein AQUCO_01300788v1 [Aquilegia coerulea]|uniref:arginine--tRNA ligase n=1 Tax=Aquilegia coerulea TaxID=218851 RepID=A0A2G5E3C5_AQUCA|nr:hypothetical protein AQUCO_01300788v1 [Aquilegia coerulea]
MMLPSKVCDYLYGLSLQLSKFRTSCPGTLNVQVVEDAGETRVSRLLLCEATRTVMSTCFDLLGILPVTNF